MDWSRWRDASRTAPYTRTGHGGDMQVERRPTGRDGAQRVTRHFPTWRDRCDKDMSGIRIARSLRRIAQFASHQCRQKAAGSPRGLLCKRGVVVASCYAVMICACGCVGGCPVIRYSATGGRSCESPGHCRRRTGLRSVSRPSARCVASRCSPVYVDKHRHVAAIILR